MGGAATVLVVGGEVARDVIPAAEQPVRVDPQLQETVSLVRDASQAGTQVCQVARTGIESAAQLVGETVAARLSCNSGDGTTAEDEGSMGRAGQPQSFVSKELCDAGGAAASGVGRVIEEMRAAKSLLRQSTASATCAAVGARYGAEAEETLDVALQATGSAQEFYSHRQILSKRGAAKAAAVSCASGAIAGSSGSEDRSAQPAADLH